MLKCSTSWVIVTALVPSCDRLLFFGHGHAEVFSLLDHCYCLGTATGCYYVVMNMLKCSTSWVIVTALVPSCDRLLFFGHGHAEVFSLWDHCYCLGTATGCYSLVMKMLKC